MAEVDIASSIDDERPGGDARDAGGQGRAARQPGPAARHDRLGPQPVPADPGPAEVHRNPRAESAAISQLVRRYALARPEVRFALTLDGHPSLKTSGSGRLETALAEVLGQEVASCLLPLAGADGRARAG